MTTKNLQMPLVERNDHTATFTITKDGQPFNITGMTIEIILKPSPQQDDSTGTTLSTSSGEVTIVDGPNGQGKVDISSTVTAAAGKGKFFRIDVLDGDKRNTAGIGSWDVLDV